MDPPTSPPTLSPPFALGNSRSSSNTLCRPWARPAPSVRSLRPVRHSGPRKMHRRPNHRNLDSPQAPGPASISAGFELPRRSDTRVGRESRFTPALQPSPINSNFWPRSRTKPVPRPDAWPAGNLESVSSADGLLPQVLELLKLLSRNASGTWLVSALRCR